MSSKALKGVFGLRGSVKLKYQKRKLILFLDRAHWGLLKVFTIFFFGCREYERITYDYPLAAAKAFSTLPEEGKSMTFVYVSGEGWVFSIFLPLCQCV